MPRTKLSVPDVAEVAPGLWSNAIRAGDMLFISGQVARPFDGGTGIVGKDEYEQTSQIFSRIDRIVKAAGGTMAALVKRRTNGVISGTMPRSGGRAANSSPEIFPLPRWSKCGPLQSRKCWWRSKPSPIWAGVEIPLWIISAVLTMGRFRA